MPATNPIFRPLLWPTVATAIALAILVGLGLWQLERLQWKLNLIATINHRMVEEPMDVPAQSEWATLDLKQLEYHRLKLEGHFLNDSELYYFAQDDEGTAGIDVVTPFVLANGAGTILVDRGFVPRDYIDIAARASGQIEGPTSLIAVARAPQARGIFSAPDDVKGNLWFTRDPVAMALGLGLANVAPFYVEADATPNVGGLPIGGRTQVNIRNVHFEYALTWFGLAAVLLAVYLAYHWSNGRVGRPKE